MDSTWTDYWGAVHTERLGFWERKRLLSVDVCQQMADGEITQAACQGYVGDLLRAINHDQLDEIEQRMKGARDD